MPSSRCAALALSFTVAVSALGVVPSTAARATLPSTPPADTGSTRADPVGAASVVALPAELRAMPRAVYLKGLTDDGHLVFREEDTISWKGSGQSQSKVAAPSGSETDLHHDLSDVVGNRILAGQTKTTVTSRQINEPNLTTQTLPAGWRLLQSMKNGLIVATGEPGEPQRVGLVPWGGTEVEDFAGLPSGIWTMEGSWGVSDGSWMVRPMDLSGNGAAASHLLIFNSTTRRIWTTPIANPVCPGNRMSSMAVRDGTVVWRSSVYGQTEKLCTLRLPAADAPLETALGETQARPLPPLPDSFKTSENTVLLPVGDEVVVSYLQVPVTWGDDPGQPIIAVAPDGSTRTLARWGLHAIPAGRGRIVAVTGDAPGEAAVRSIEVSTGAAEVVRPIAPVKAWYTSIGIDGSDVAYANDSAAGGAIRRRTVDFAEGTASPPELVDKGAPGPVVTGGGTVAWALPSRLDSTDRSMVLRADGTRTATAGWTPRRAETGWVQLADRVLNTETDTYYPYNPGSPRFETPAFQDGVTYTPGASIAGAPRGSIVARDIVTKKAEMIDIPGCSEARSVQVARSWLAVYCASKSGQDWIIVDRTGTHPSWVSTTSSFRLGNGFMLQISQSGDVEWAPLAPGAADWRPLGQVSLGPGDRDPGHAVALGTGAVPSAAWLDARRAYVARFPVWPSPLPPHPTGVTPPSAPKISLQPDDRYVTVSWEKPAATEEITRYEVRAQATGGTGSPSSAKAETNGAATRVTVGPLANGRPYEFTVVANNLAGSASTVAQATPLEREPAPTNVRVNVSPVTGEATVRWDFTPVVGWDTSSFQISFDDEISFVEVPASDRSVSLGVPRARSTSVYVTATINHQPGTGWGKSPVVSFPGPDTVAPQVSLTGLPWMSVDGAVRFSVAASDDRALDERPVDVRVRSAAAGQRLGPWNQPMDLQQRAPGEVHLPRLPAGSTACYSARARDSAGLVSEWTTPTCTSVLMDEGVFKRKGKTKVLRSAAYHRGSAVRLANSKASLTLAGLNANTSYLLATTCAKCGRLSIYVGRRNLGQVSLYSSTTRHGQLIRLPSVVRSGTFSFRAQKSKAPVDIDGALLVAN